jgi:hypothetical protein
MSSNQIQKVDGCCKYLGLEPSNEELQKGLVFAVEQQNGEWIRTRDAEQKFEERAWPWPKTVVVCAFISTRQGRLNAGIVSADDYDDLRHWRNALVYDRDHHDEIIASKEPGNRNTSSGNNSRKNFGKNSSRRHKRNVRNSTDWLSTRT